MRRFTTAYNEFLKNRPDKDELENDYQECQQLLNEFDEGKNPSEGEPSASFNQNAEKTSDAPPTENANSTDKNTDHVMEHSNDNKTV